MRDGGVPRDAALDQIARAHTAARLELDPAALGELGVTRAAELAAIRVVLDEALRVLGDESIRELEVLEELACDNGVEARILERQRLVALGELGELKVGGTDTLLFVMDLVSATKPLASAQGTPVKPVASVSDRSEAIAEGAAPSLHPQS